MKHILFISAVLFVFLSVISCGKKPQNQAQAAGDTTIEEAIDGLAAISTLQGEVKVIRAGVVNSVTKTGVVLQESDVIETKPGSRVDITIKGKGVVSLKPGSSFKLNKLNAGNVETSLSKGKMLCALKKLERNHTFSVRTPTAVAGVRGTSFLLATDEGQSKISVLTGKMEVKNDAGQTVMVDEKKETSFTGTSIDKAVTIRGDSLAEVKDLLTIRGVDSTGEVESMKANLKALDINDQKTLGQLEAERALEGRALQTGKKNISATGKDAAADVKRKTSTTFENENDMMVK